MVPAALPCSNAGSLTTVVLVGILLQELDVYTWPVKAGLVCHPEKERLFPIWVTHLLTDFLSGIDVTSLGLSSVDHPLSEDLVDKIPCG
jgi:hypothetical protein